MTRIFLSTLPGGNIPTKLHVPGVMLMAAQHPRSFLTDSEVLQELLHRYLSSGRWSLGRVVFQSFAEVMRDRVEPVYLEDVERAGNLADNYPEVSTRDLVHAAVMKRLGVDRIISADTDFDNLPGVIRLAPAAVGEWSGSLLIN